MPHTYAKAYALAITAAGWLGAVAFVLESNLIFRETPLGAIARILGKLPSPLQGILFLACWAAFFLGWIVPLFYALRMALGPQKR